MNCLYFRCGRGRFLPDHPQVTYRSLRWTLQRLELESLVGSNGATCWKLEGWTKSRCGHCERTYADTMLLPLDMLTFAPLFHPLLYFTPQSAGKSELATGATICTRPTSARPRRQRRTSTFLDSWQVSSPSPCSLAPSHTFFVIIAHRGLVFISSACISVYSNICGYGCGLAVMKI